MRASGVGSEHKSRSSGFSFVTRQLIDCFNHRVEEIASAVLFAFRPRCVVLNGVKYHRMNPEARLAAFSFERVPPSVIWSDALASHDLL